MPKLLLLGALAVVALVLTGGARAATTVEKSGDESVASSTVKQDDDELFFTAAAGVAYLVEADIIYASPAGAGTPDLRLGFFEDGTARGIMVTEGYYNASESVTEGTNAPTNDSASVISGTAAADRVTTYRGWHVGNGGTFKVRWAQGTSDANATIVRAGSTLTYTRVDDQSAGGGGAAAWGDITGKPAFNLSWLDDVDTTGAIDGTVLKYDEAASEWQVAVDEAGGEGSSGPVTLSAGDRERLDLNWWGVWAIVGLLLVLMIAPQLMSVMRVTRGMADGRG